MSDLVLAVGLGNVILGTIYTCYGLMTIVDMRRGWAKHGFSHFGAAWIAMAFTCGPHHLDHGAHALFAGRAGGPLDLIALLAGFPVGAIWFLLRVEAMLGGRGDRFVSGTPVWLENVPTFAAVYATAMVTAAIAVGGHHFVFGPRLLPNVALVVLYLAIAAVLLRGQLQNHRPVGGWSVSGVSLAAVFFTCAVMHGVYTIYAGSGRYAPDIHGLVIDTLSVPAAMYFLWVVSSLHRGTLRDWNAPRPAARMALIA
jgi:hypothetical protein